LGGAAGLTIAGDIDVDGTTNLDVVDIDGAVDMASTLGVGGRVTAAGVTTSAALISTSNSNNLGNTTISALIVDNFTLDGTTLALSSGDMTLDVAGDIILDADGGDIRFHDGGTLFGKITQYQTDMYIDVSTSDRDMFFRGIDAGVQFTALTLDMSDAGAATFNSRVGIGTAPSNTLLGSNYGTTLLHIDGGSDRGQIILEGDTIATIIMSDNGATADSRVFMTQVTDGLMKFKGLNDNGTSKATILSMTSDGNVTMPSQPAFQVRPASAQSNIAVSTAVTIVLGTEAFDVGANFASNTFTAPVTGKYQLNVEIRLDNIDTVAVYYHLNLITSNGTYFSIVDPGVLASDPAYWSLGLSVLADMDASDTAYLAIYQAGGTAQTDINADTGNTIFSGYLAC